MTDPTTPEVFAARLRVGEGLPLAELVDDDLFPFEGEIRLKPLAPPMLPEPRRFGEGGGDGCWNCTHQETGASRPGCRWC
jgi:hypothetical protein